MPVARALRLRREAWGFAVGSLLFLVGSIPIYADTFGVVGTNVTFFIGALFFTAAAFVQFALSRRRRPDRSLARPDIFDWWAALVQFGGTLFFNVSTSEALLSAVNSASRVGSGWRPDAFGSTCFLVASVLAIIATTERNSLWDPNARVWRCTWLNMLGSIFFAIAAVAAFAVPGTDDLVSHFWSNLGTALGAVCFLTAALLSRPGPRQRSAAISNVTRAG